MVGKGHPKLNGREPEFGAPSRRPGIGVPAIPMIAQAMIDGFAAWDKDVDVPGYLNGPEGRKLQLGRLLKGKLREELGRPAETPEYVLREWQQKMQTVLRFAAQADLLPKEVHIALDQMKMDRMEFWEKAKPKRETI